MVFIVTICRIDVEIMQLCPHHEYSVAIIFPASNIGVTIEVYHVHKNGTKFKDMSPVDYLCFKVGGAWKNWAADLMRDGENCASLL